MDAIKQVFVCIDALQRKESHIQLRTTCIPAVGSELLLTDAEYETLAAKTGKTEKGLIQTYKWVSHVRHIRVSDYNDMIVIQLSRQRSSY